MWNSAFNVVSIDYSHKYCPRVEFTIPYYCFGKPGKFRFGSRLYGANNPGYAINRPTVDQIFNRQSVRTPTENITRKDSEEYIHMPSLRTDSERRLISAIVNASSASPTTWTYPMGKTTNRELDISDLRTLFQEFLNEIHPQEPDPENTKLCTSSNDRKVRFKENKEDF